MQPVFSKVSPLKLSGFLHPSLLLVLAPHGPEPQQLACFLFLRFLAGHADTRRQSWATTQWLPLSSRLASGGTRHPSFAPRKVPELSQPDLCFCGTQARDSLYQEFATQLGVLERGFGSRRATADSQYIVVCLAENNHSVVREKSAGLTSSL